MNGYSCCIFNTALISEVISGLDDCAESDVDPRIAAGRKQRRTVRVIINCVIYAFDRNVPRSVGMADGISLRSRRGGWGD